MLIEKTLFNEFKTLNSKRWANRPFSKKKLFVNAGYNDLFIVFSTMKISIALADLYEYDIIVLPYIKAKQSSVDLIKSFKPVEILPIKLLLLLSFFRHGISTFANIWKMRCRSDILSFKLHLHSIGIHLYDSLLRRLMIPTIHSLSFAMRLQIFFELIYYHALFDYLKRHDDISFVVLPDNVYRDGLLFEIIKSKNIPSITGIDLNGISAHLYRTVTDYDEHCRVPDNEILRKILSNNHLAEKAEHYLRERFSANIVQHDVMRAFSENKEYIDRAEFCKRHGLDPHKKIVIVMAHIFCDAPHGYPGLLFDDYEDWLIQTCEALHLNKHINFIVKEHPSADLYSEEGVLDSILTKLNLEDKILSRNINTRSLFIIADFIVTCGGTAGMEFPCFGVPVVVAAMPPYSQYSYVYSSSTKNEYLHTLKTIETIQRLTDKQKTEAKGVIFLMLKGMQVPKKSIGLGSQDYYMGARIDYNTFIAEMIDDIKSQNGFTSLQQSLKTLIDGNGKNLVNHELLF